MAALEDERGRDGAQPTTGGLRGRRWACPPWLSIGPMRYEDLDQVVAIERASFRTPWSRSAFLSELLENQRACYLVARNGSGAIVGYAGAWLVLEEAHVTNVAVHPDWRRQGVGEALMRAIMETTAQKGARRMTLEVRTSNETARRLYERLGFVKIGVRPRYYQDNDEDALVMWREGLETEGRGSP